MTPSIELASNRWTSNTSGSLYYKTGAFALVGIAFDYRFMDHFDLNVGIQNLTDENYRLVGGFPEPGRTFFLELRFRQ
jgi:iron complex outermembrane receptor protein